ncbi:PREDICTED: zinc finger protein ZAT5-like [Ipomoea nil]|uniref:zinc finger protein ZAT5-like n=1 Tax=Ipomoea nil TaxID=35883 RepID=UPI000900B269|nr:PREDICTED: zinc finger protein ZAT5-like [Ipomoea nil]
MEISQEYSDYQMVLIKGKRTKRPRGLSPADSSCSSGGGDGGAAAVFYSSSAQYSPATSTSQISATTNDEDEDMANCLILLARGGGCRQVERVSGSRKVDEMAAAAAGAGKGGGDLYVYQCKTCNRTFPSFQALGGHRASHKKPKITAADDQKKSAAPSSSDFDKQSSPLFAAGVSTHTLSNGGKAKIHECSICGSEFSSGQALGGHMRRHRPPPTINPAKPLSVISDGGTANVSESSDRREKAATGGGGVFTLDLNLPAPLEDDDDDQETKLQNLAFSTPALVDCHY